MIRSVHIEICNIELFPEDFILNAPVAENSLKNKERKNACAAQILKR